MKTIGVIGGMSWESTALYYQTINREVARQLGGLHSAPLLLHSLDFAHVVRLQQAGAWDELGAMLTTAARSLQAAGAELVLIATNTMHRVAPRVQHALNIPLLHIVDVTAAQVAASGMQRVALLGTRYTMEQSFYSEHLARHGLSCVVPEEVDRAEIHRIIFEELCQGQVLDASRQSLLRIIETLHRQGAQGVILGCTELPMLLQQGDGPLRLFDTTRLHALAAVEHALAPVPAGEGTLKAGQK
jgi:aspartate racemase